MDVAVQALSEHPEFIPVAARWHFSEWGHTDPAGTPESWTAGLAGMADAAGVPGTLLAVADGAAVGVVCLSAADMPGYPAAAGLTPWLKGLYVAPAARGRGYGELLTRRCAAWAGSLGYEALYLYTRRESPAEALYLKLGWRSIHLGHYDGMDATVMRTTLSAV
jgi:GNAT superfamily N-acetyltransferase